MLKQTVSLLRRMVARPSPTTQAEPGEKTTEERRVRARYPSTVETTLLPVHGAAAVRLTAQVRNISRSGIHLVLPRPFEPGAMLAIDLPATVGDAAQSVLACVAHLGIRAGGDWGVGCTFARELGYAELAAFGVKPQRPPAPHDPREWTRLPCRVRATCQLATAAEVQSFPAEVLNISPSGIGLLVESLVETGALLSLDLHGDAGQATTTILACVVHVQLRDHGRRALGCNFIRELSEQELQSLL